MAPGSASGLHGRSCSQSIEDQAIITAMSMESSTTRRAPKACLACRSLKAKCVLEEHELDKARPKCVRCRRLVRECLFTDGRRSASGISGQAKRSSESVHRELPAGDDDGSATAVTTAHASKRSRTLAVSDNGQSAGNEMLKLGTARPGNANNDTGSALAAIPEQNLFSHTSEDIPVWAQEDMAIPSADLVSRSIPDPLEVR